MNSFSSDVHGRFIWIGHSPEMPAPVISPSSGFVALPDEESSQCGFTTGFSLTAPRECLSVAGPCAATPLAEGCAEERVVLVDDTGRPIGTELKSRVHGADTPLHLAFSVFLFSPDGSMLVQRRALHKATWPGVWSNACCGHPLPGESLEDAVSRRLRYELGLERSRTILAHPRFRYRVCWNRIWENEICPIFIGLCPGEPFANPREVADLGWVDWRAFAAGCHAGDDPFFKDFSPWSLMEGRLLDSSGAVVRLLNGGR